jgi:prepilin-type N-terminal cleavage/methylation domain-containing protein
MSLRGQSGFSLIEIMIVIAVIVVIVAIAIPSLLRSEMGANETSAIATLKALGTAQHQFRLSKTVDQDADGRGEYGFLQELAGDEIPRACTAPLQSGAFISASLGITNRGMASRSGYIFLMYLPTADTRARRERDGAAAPRRNEANFQEGAWTCYAWPERRDYSGTRVFVVNETGQIMTSNNTGARQGYDGTRTFPAANAAYVNGTRGCIGELAGPDDAATDGGTWTPAG